MVLEGLDLLKLDAYDNAELLELVAQGQIARGVVQGAVERLVSGSGLRAYTRFMSQEPSLREALDHADNNDVMRAAAYRGAFSQVELNDLKGHLDHGETLADFVDSGAGYVAKVVGQLLTPRTREVSTYSDPHPCRH